MIDAADAADPARLACREPNDMAGQGRLLIVDDEEVVAGSLQRRFSNEHEVTVVTSGRAALDRLCARELYDAIVCDLMMPATSGVNLHTETEAKRARTGRAHHFFDGVARGGVAARGAVQPRDARSDSWRPSDFEHWHRFAKPCNLQELRAAIRRQIARSRGM